MPIKISQQFDAGAIEVLSADAPDAITLNLRQDTHAEFSQWFYFRLQGGRDTACTMCFMNAGQATYPDGWKDYQAVASYDRETWFRVPTTFDGQVMTITHTPQRDSVYYAYFEPYSWERHLQLLARAERSPLVRVQDIGSTVEGRDMNLVVVGDPAAAKKVWVIARQHPGETMAEWFVEGMLEALTRPGQSGCAAFAGGSGVVYRAEHESGRGGAWQFAHQCGRCESEPGVDDAVDGVQPRGVCGEGENPGDRLRLVPGRARG